MAGRDLTDPYDATLNKLSVNQDQLTKSAWEIAGAIHAAAKSDSKLEWKEILDIAVDEAPDAFRDAIEIFKDDVPLGEDIDNVAWGFRQQLKPFREGEGEE